MPTTATAAPTTATAAPPTATAAPPTVGSLVGKWKVSAVEGAGGMPADLLHDLWRDTFSLRPDSTFRSRNDRIGAYGGAWALNGSVVTLTPDPSEFSPVVEPSTLAVDCGQLKRTVGNFTTIYERQPADADEPQFKLTVAHYVADLNGDESVLKRKYLGRTIELDGVVEDGGDSYVTIYGPQPAAQKPGSEVMCRTIEKEPFAHLGPGQSVTVRGEVSDDVLYPGVIEAEIVRAGSPTLVTITAEDLARAFAKDPESTARKYTARKFVGKTLLLSGPLLEIKPNSVGDPSNVIVGTADANVTCIFPTEKSVLDKIETLKRGEAIKLVGVFNISITSGTSARLQESRLVMGR